MIIGYKKYRFDPMPDVVVLIVMLSVYAITYYLFLQG